MCCIVMLSFIMLSFFKVNIVMSSCWVMWFFRQIFPPRLKMCNAHYLIGLSIETTNRFWSKNWEKFAAHLPKLPSFTINVFFIFLSIHWDEVKLTNLVNFNLILYNPTSPTPNFIKNWSLESVTIPIKTFEIYHFVVKMYY